MSSSLHHSIFQYSKDIDCSEWLLIVVSSLCFSFGLSRLSRTDDIIYSQSGTLIAVSSQEGLVHVDPNPCSASRKRSDVRPLNAAASVVYLAIIHAAQRSFTLSVHSKTRKLHCLGVVDKSVHVDPVILDVPLEDFWIDSFKRELWVVLTNRCTGSRHMRRPVYEK
ncbi:hypothetical protein JB92DRAFT_3101351 [Gautieria morchelliformis]|nr:hypothetical protein JB92DRAFT_3101351 [Gautieria morchelliformis]